MQEFNSEHASPNTKVQESDREEPCSTPEATDERMLDALHLQRLAPLRIVSGLAENTNAIFSAHSSEPQTANGCPVLLRAGTIS